MVKIKPSEIETLSTRIAYENRWMRVREDIIRRQDGSEGLYGVVEKSDFAVIIPVDEDGRVHMVEQYRYPVGGRFWELPQGSWEEAPDADPLTLARGELREETGLVAAEMIHVGHLYECYGYSNQGYDIYLARRLSVVDRDLGPEEIGLVTNSFAAAQIVAMINSGSIKDGATIAALGLAQIKGLISLI